MDLHDRLTEEYRR